MKKFIILTLFLFATMTIFGQTFFSKGLISNGDVIIKNSAGLAINGDTVNHIYSSGDSLIFTTKGGKKFKAPVNPVDENRLNKKFGVIDSIRVSVTGDSTIFYSGTDTVMIGLLNPSTHPPADCENLHGYISVSNTSLDCNNPFVSLTGSSNQADVSYQWDGSVSGDLGTTNPLIAFLAETITLTVTNNTTACQDQVQYVIAEDYTQPTLVRYVTSPNIDSEVVCGVFVTNPITGRQYSYSWAGTGITTSTAVQFIKVNATGNFTATVTDLTNGCNQNTVLNVVAADFNYFGNNIIDSISIRKIYSKPLIKTFSSSVTLDCDSSMNHYIILTGDINISLNNYSPGSTITLKLIQDGSGGHTPTFSTGFDYISDQTALFNENANKINLIVIYFDENNKGLYSISTY